MTSPYIHPDGGVAAGLGSGVAAGLGGTGQLGGGVAAGLAGTGQLADDLFLMAHDDVTGRPFLQPRAAGLGLAGGLLGELMLAGTITTWQGRVVITGPATPGDRLRQAIAGLVADERDPRPVRDWLAYLARTATRDVAARLEHAGYLAPAPGRRWRRDPGWVPVDANWAFAPLARARSALADPQRAPAGRAALAGLAVACGLGHRLLPYGPPDARARLDDAIARLPAGLRELIARTQAAVDSAVLCHRL